MKIWTRTPAWKRSQVKAGPAHHACYCIFFHPFNSCPSLSLSHSSTSDIHDFSSSPACMWRSVFGDPQLASQVQVKQNYWGMFLGSMAGPVGLSMGAFPLHWQPEDFYFVGGRRGAPSRQLSHIIPDVSAAFVGTAEPWGSLMMCTCEEHLRIWTARVPVQAVGLN